MNIKNKEDLSNKQYMGLRINPETRESLMMIKEDYNCPTVNDAIELLITTFLKYQNMIYRS